MKNLNEVRQAIDGLDGKLIELLAQRQKLVEQAGRLKPRNDAQAVAARRKQALAAGLSPDVAEAVWQAMIQAFVRLETEINREEE